MPQSRTLLRATVVVALMASVLVLGTSPTAAAPTSISFTTPGADTFVVPDGVCELTVDLYGAQGGASSTSLQDGGEQVVDNGALGGRATATLAVTPGESLQVNVGGAGGDATTSTSTAPTSTASAGVGGFNGGGEGSATGATRSGTTIELAVAAASGGGGGASDVRQGGTAPANRVVTAGGGAGGTTEAAGVNDTGATFRNAGGTSGGGAHPSGVDGTAGSGADPGGGGGGGTQTSGGAAGTSSGVFPGNPGTLGVGGDGEGFATNANIDGGTVGAVASGGGGGGQYGGGSGGSTGSASSADIDGSGGSGGGSSFGPTGASFQTAVQAGNGEVTISYDQQAGTCGVNANANTDALCSTFEAIVLDLVLVDIADDPAGIEEFMTDYIALLDQGVTQAPADIFDQWVTVRNAVVDIDVIFASVGYDLTLLTAQQLNDIDAIVAQGQPAADAVEAWANTNCVEPLLPVSSPAATPTSSTPAFTG